MKPRKFRIAIQSPKKTLDDFEKTWKRIESKTSKQDDADDVVLYFSDSSQIAKILSPERLRLIQMIQDEKPLSVTKLAQLLDRAQANVQRDVTFLAGLGILDLKKKKSLKNDLVQPQFNWSGFDIDLTKRRAS